LFVRVPDVRVRSVRNIRGNAPAYLTLKLFEPNFEAVAMPFDKILDAVKNDVVEAGLLIHEGQLLFPQMGLHRNVLVPSRSTCSPGASLAFPH
jgi:predicted solute-binding protein